MTTHPDASPIRGGGFWSLLFVLAAFAFLFCCWLGGLAYATEAPGCGNQHFRPRLSQCCPRFCAGEAMPNKCNAALNAGFLGECCGEVIKDCVNDCGPGCRTVRVANWYPRRPKGDHWALALRPGDCICDVPTPAPSPTCPTEWWYCPHDSTPTPYATPASKGSCCAQVLREYRDRRHAIIDAKQAELKTLIRWKQGQMAQCRELYGSR